MTDDKTTTTTGDIPVIVQDISKAAHAAARMIDRVPRGSEMLFRVHKPAVGGNVVIEAFELSRKKVAEE